MYDMLKQLTETGMTLSAKSETTRATIIGRALEMASQHGLEALTMGTLADSMKMSKSGGVARVGSREALQLAVLTDYQRRFEAQVLTPAAGHPPGLPRLRLLFDLSLRQVSLGGTAGCFHISCAAEYDDRPGILRHAVSSAIEAWRSAFDSSARQAVALGQLAPELDVGQLVFEIYAVLLATQHDIRLLQHEDSAERARRAFERLLAARVKQVC